MCYLVYHCKTHLVHFTEFFFLEDKMILTYRKLVANKILSSEVFDNKK